MPAAPHRLCPTESHWSFCPEWMAATLISSRLVPQQLSIDKYIMIFILEVCSITCLWSVLICLTETSWIVQAAPGKPSCASAISRTVFSVWCPPERNSCYLLKFHHMSGFRGSLHENHLVLSSVDEWHTDDGRAEHTSLLSPSWECEWWGASCVDWWGTCWQVEDDLGNAAQQGDSPGWCVGDALSAARAGCSQCFLVVQSGELRQAGSRYQGSNHSEYWDPKTASWGTLIGWCRHHQAAVCPQKALHIVHIKLLLHLGFLLWEYNTYFKARDMSQKGPGSSSPSPQF